MGWFERIPSRLADVNPLAKSRSTLPYLMLFATAVIGGNLAEYIFRSSAVFKGQSFGIILTFSLAIASIMAWVLAPGFRRLTSLTRLALLLLICLWALSLSRAIAESSAFNYTALLTPIFLLMLLLKTPDFKESVFFANFVAAALASAAIITQFLDLTGLRSFRTDIQARWSIPIPWLDIPARWEGMFGDPNNAGFIGAFLIVYGLRRTGLFRIYIVVVGSLIVILSQSRTALLAVLIGLAVLLFASSWYRARRFRTSTTMLLIFGSLLFAIAGLLSIDSTFNGRVPIWKASLDLVSENPLFGIGSRGFSVAASAGEIPWNNIDSHNILLDTLLRNGLGAFLLAGAFIVVCLILVTRVIGFDRGTSLAVLLTFFAAAMTYTVTTWIYINVQVLPLIVALLLANSLALMNPGRIRD